MVIDFSKITVYELIALILSFIAIMIPIVQWAWNKWIVKPILKLLPTGKINPYFNRSGSYLGIESVYEAINKPITVKHIALKIVRCRDEKKLNQVWSSFWSPITQRFSGNYSSTIEGAHPFRIEKNSITTAFTEFEDLHNTLQRSLAEYDKDVDFFIKDCLTQMLPFNETVEKFEQQPFFKNMKDILLQEFFWDIGKYKIEILVKYDETEKSFSYEFEINEVEHNKLLHNLKETLLVPLKQAYKLPLGFQGVTLKLDD